MQPATPAVRHQCNRVLRYILDDPRFSAGDPNRVVWKAIRSKAVAEPAGARNAFFKFSTGQGEWKAGHPNWRPIGSTRMEVQRNSLDFVVDLMFDLETRFPRGSSPSGLHQARMVKLPCTTLVY